MPALRLYVDGSMSMAGFVASPQSTYTRVVQRLYSRVLTANYPLEAFRFSDGVRSIGGNLASELRQPAFYNGLGTPITSLLNTINTETGNGNVSIFISDFVQSERGLDQTHVVRALQAISAHQPEIVLLAFRSSFRGLYYMETVPRGARAVAIEEGPAGRPFYVFAVAPCARELERLRNYVLTGLEESETFHPTAMPVFIAENWKIASGQGIPAIWKRRSSVEKIVTPGQHPVYREDYEPKSALLAENPLTLDFDATFNVPIRAVERLAWHVRKTRFQPAGTAPAPAELTFRPVVAVAQPSASRSVLANSTAPAPAGPRRSRLRVTYLFPAPASRTWDVYRLQIRAGQGNLDVPAWVRDWSTYNDQLPDQDSRTLHLELFVEAMVRGLTENVVFFDQIISLGRN